jgi:hypothetical protein
MLYRSGYATKPGQESILKIKLTHSGFLSILAQSVASAFDPAYFASVEAWRAALHASDVRHQWDPDRASDGRKLKRRAIQIGIKGEAIRRYVNDWIIALEEVTALAHSIREAVTQQLPLPEVPCEHVYPVGAELQQRLGIDAG